MTGKGFLLLRHPICVIDRQLGMNDAPILPPSGPFLRNVHHGEIQHFQQTVIRRKNRLGFGDLAKLAIEALNGIGRIDQPANLLRELEIRAQIRPVFPPGSGDPGDTSFPRLLQMRPGRFGPTAHPPRHKQL